MGLPKASNPLCFAEGGLQGFAFEWDVLPNWNFGVRKEIAA